MAGSDSKNKEKLMTKYELVHNLGQFGDTKFESVKIPIVQDGAKEPQFVEVGHCYYHDKVGFVLVPDMPLEVCLT